MKQLLNGVAIAAALVIAAPAFAQAPKAPPPAAAPAASAAPAAKAPAAKAPMAAKQMHHRAMRHVAHHGHMGKKNAGDAMTDQLNREELARIQGGAPGAPMPPPPGAGPRPSGH